jgi:hypothetical protein
MKVALVRLQLRRRHILNGDRVVSGIGNDGVAMGVVMCCRKKRVYACKYGVADLDGVRLGREVCEGDLTKIRCKHKCIVGR